MKLTATWSADGQVHTVSTKPVDVMLWEKSTGQRIGAGMGFVDMAAMVFTASQRAGLAGESFDDWMESLDELDLQPGNPTQRVEEPFEG